MEHFYMCEVPHKIFLLATHLLENILSHNDFELALAIKANLIFFKKGTIH